MKTKHRPMGPEVVSATGQPMGPKVTTTGPVGQGKQPGHAHLAQHPATGTKKPHSPPNVKQMIHKHSGGSAPQMRVAGQVLHHSGQHHGGSSSKPYAKVGRQLPHPGQPEKAGKGSGGGEKFASMTNMKQAAVSPYGTLKRFMAFRMTPKSDGM